MGAGLATVHFGRYSPLGLSYPSEAMERNMESIGEITGFAEELGLDVAFENAPNNFGALAGSLDVLERLISDTGVMITLDVGHANTWTGSVEDYIHGLNSAIAHVHLHDNTGESDMHLALGAGKMDLGSVFRAFRKINYKRAFCLEMLYQEDLRRSMSRIKALMDGSG
ncbi:MAG: sugar phosphate isomerase/epimerase [Methanobacteriota archaeon]|nr:MAG: sugar phosphate isomerase/epimerase [Euryarchaeota archaeon]